ncbi:MAG: DarT ssDNA thymidine ADP-ribosyltransferase family protein [Patescibacteria group bacterium]|nr:DarT ssDNA thymidine ADP-ribosyltransferase family protein [Patescibacteria group bacterium]
MTISKLSKFILNKIAKIRNGYNPLKKDGTKMKFKKNYLEYKNILEKEGIKKIYHLTDSNNIESIKRHGGLYSRKYCESNNIKIYKTGGNDLSKKFDSQDSLENSEDYVRLSFVEDQPMFYRRSNIVCLEIGIEVIYWDATFHSDINATTQRQKPIIGKDIDCFKKIRFDIIKKGWMDLNYSDREIRKRYYQAEIMVKTFIPIKFIKNINIL